MKNKILTVILSVALAFTIVFASFSVYATSEIQIGDANGDGVINLMDVTHLAQYVAGWDVKLGESAPVVSEPVVSEPTTPTPTGVNFNNANEENYLSTLPTTAGVHILMWRKWLPSEQKLIDDYQKKTGVKITTTFTTESEYPTKLVSMVSAGNSPDIIRFSTNHFPGLVIKALQPLNEEKFHLSADCWNKKYMDAFSINGKYFGVAMAKTWDSEDQNYVTYYSPQVLKSCGVTTTPYELYKQGKWTWETEKQIILKAKYKGINGLIMQSYDSFMHSTGVDFASYNGSTYTNNLGEVKAADLLSKAWMHAAELKGSDLFGSWDINALTNGQTGLFTAISYGFYNEGQWFDPAAAKNFEAVPVAGLTATAYTPVKVSNWGVPKKAPNPDGAAYFLRYFLDVSNYDQSTTFYNDQFKEVFERITASTAKKSIMYGAGIADYVESGTYSSVCNLLVATTPQNIATQLNARKGNFETAILRANKDLARIK